MNLMTNVTKCLHKYSLPLPGHLALRSCLIVGMMMVSISSRLEDGRSPGMVFLTAAVALPKATALAQSPSVLSSP